MEQKTVVIDKKMLDDVIELCRKYDALCNNVAVGDIGLPDKVDQDYLDGVQTVCEYVINELTAIKEWWYTKHDKI